jgi:hypothetical protein
MALSFGHSFVATDRVGAIGISSVHDNVASFQIGCKIVYDTVNDWTCSNVDKNRPWWRQFLTKFFKATNLNQSCLQQFIWNYFDIKTANPHAIL